jgi:hypothetical protein
MTSTEELRAELIAAGVIRPGGEVTRIRIAPERIAIRLDAAGRAAAAREIAEGPSNRQERRMERK